MVQFGRGCPYYFAGHVPVWIRRSIYADAAPSGRDAPDFRDEIGDDHAESCKAISMVAEHPEQSSGCIQ